MVIFTIEQIREIMVNQNNQKYVAIAHVDNGK